MDYICAGLAIVFFYLNCKIKHFQMIAQFASEINI